ncbi:MAG: transcriptional regulator [Erysipelotrichia bacterium]|nr:transcriptional regulator [Erysipelotrichia bacterium]NCC54503.1 transcriptional regulator [Erysipelotrichia bacterium]
MEHKCVIDQEMLETIKTKQLENEEISALSILFKMYADATRLKILNLLFERELCVCDIAYLLDMTHSAISHQLAILRSNRIIKVRREGKNMFYSLDDDHIQLIFNNGLTHIREEG